MLDGIRKASKNWLGRIVLTFIMGILVISFAIWGIGDMLRVTGTTYVAKLGKAEISAEALRNAYNTTLEEVSQRLRRRLTNDEAKLFGLDRQVLSKLVTESALDQKARALGLNISDEDVVRSVMAEPSLRGPNGQFDRAKFFDILRQNGMNEAAFFAEQKRSMLRRQLSQAIAGDFSPPQALVDAAYQYVSEQREVAFFILPKASVGEIAAPDEAALKAYYETRKVDFRAPEFRKVNILAAEPKNLGIDLTVTEADLRRVYDRALAQGQLGTPAKRQVLQVLYPTEAEATAAATKLKGGATFESLLEERKIKLEDADLGLKTQREFADAAIAAAAFATAEGAVAAPVKTAFGFALIKVTKIDPGTQVPFEQAKDRLGDAAAADKLRSDPRLTAKLDEISKKVEDARIAGKSLAEAAPLVGLTLRTIDGIDNTGKDRKGDKVALPGGDELTKAIFQSDIGLDNDAVRPKEGGVVWFDIAGVESARDRTFDEVKADLLVAWKADEAGKRLRAKTDDYVKRLDAGEDIAAVAKDAGVQPSTSTINRNAGGAVGNTGAAQAFAVTVGKAASATVDDVGRVVLKVLKSNVSPLDPASGVGLQLSKQMTTQMSEDVLSQYVQRLQNELGLTINQKALQTAIGGGSGS